MQDLFAGCEMPGGKMDGTGVSIAQCQTGESRGVINVNTTYVITMSSVLCAKSLLAALYPGESVYQLTNDVSTPAVCSMPVFHTKETRHQ